MLQLFLIYLLSSCASDFLVLGPATFWNISKEAWFAKIKQYNNQGSFEGWLKRIIINTALQKYRKKNHLQLIKEVPDTEEVVEVDFEDTHLDIGFLLKLVQELPDKYRLVFNLYVLDSYSHKEISKMLNISEGTSKSNLSRARKKLKEKLEKHQQREQYA